MRKPSFSNQRRLELQILVGLLTDNTGFPLAVSAFEGNKVSNTHDAVEDPTTNVYL